MLGDLFVLRGVVPGACGVTVFELHDDVARVAAALRAMGIEPGDRVAGFMPNVPETVIAMLGAVSVGAVQTQFDGFILRICFARLRCGILFRHNHAHIFG